MNKLTRTVVAILVLVYCVGSAFVVSAENKYKSFVDEQVYAPFLFEEDPADEFLAEKREINRLYAENQLDAELVELLRPKFATLITKTKSRYGENYVDWDVIFATLKSISMNTEAQYLQFLADNRVVDIDKLRDENIWQELEIIIRQTLKTDGLVSFPELYFTLDKLLVNTCRENLGEEDPVTLKREIKLIQDYSVLGDSKFALDRAQDLLPKVEAAFGENSAEVVELLNIMAYDYKTLGNYRASEETLRRTIAASIELHGEESSPELAASLVALTKLINATPTSAPELYDALKKAAKNTPGEDLYELYAENMADPINAEYAHESWLNFLSAEYELLTDYRYRRDSSIKELDMMLEASKGYRELGLYDRSLTSDLFTINICRAYFRKHHHKTLVALCNLSDDYLKMNQLEEALTLAQAAFETSQKTYGDEHPCTVFAIHALTNVYRKMGRYKDALSLDMKACLICKKIFVGSSAGEPQETLTALMDVADDCKDLKNYSEAIFFYKVVFSKYVPNGAYELKAAEALKNLASLYNLNDEYEKTLHIYNFLKKDDFFYSFNSLKVGGLIVAHTAAVLSDALAVVGKNESEHPYHPAHYTYEESVDEFEDVRNNNSYYDLTYATDENRREWFSQTVPYYKKAAAFYVSQSYDEEAFRAAELCRGRTLADQYNKLLAPYKIGCNEDEIQTLNEYRKQIAQYKSKFSEEFAHGSDGLKFNLMFAHLQMMNKYNEYMISLGKKYPDY